jgi:hypothetical protein
MATGSGLGGLIPLAMTVAGVLTMLRASARRRSGTTVADPEAEARLASRLEMERRMASYLAERDAGRAAATDDSGIEQEIRR